MVQIMALLAFHQLVCRANVTMPGGEENTDTLAPGRSGWVFENAIFELVLLIAILTW